MIDARVVIDAAFLAKAGPMQAIDPLWWRIEPPATAEGYDGLFAPYSHRQRLVWAMVQHGAEVGNGGHDQFFWNRTGIVWRDALEGYADAGIGDVHAILTEAVALTGGDPPLDKIARCELMQELKPDFFDLDDRFFPILNGDLGERIMAYVRAHAADFAFDGIVRKPPPFEFD